MANLSANIPPTGPLIGLHLPMGFTDAVASSPGESGGKEQLQRAVSRDIPRVLSALDGFDMAKRYLHLAPKSGVSPYSIAVIVLPKTLPTHL